MRIRVDKIAEEEAARKAAGKRDQRDREAARRRDEQLLAGDRETAHESRHREVYARINLPVSLVVEARLLVAILSDTAVLAICAGVELDDFTDFRHRMLFKAMRNLQAAGRWDAAEPHAWIGAISDELERTDARDDKHERAWCDDTYLAELLARHIWDTYGPPGAPIAAWVEHDARRLRELAEQRRAL